MKRYSTRLPSGTVVIIEGQMVDYHTTLRDGSVRVVRVIGAESQKVLSFVRIDDIDYPTALSLEEIKDYAQDAWMRLETPSH